MPTLRPSRPARRRGSLGPVLAAQTGSAGVRPSRSMRCAVLVLTLLATVVVLALPASAATLVGHSGTTGRIYGLGGTACNPFVSGGFAARYVEIGSPLVEETPQVVPAGTSIVGGTQKIFWQPWLEKYVSGRWVRVWTGDWYSRNSYSNVTTFADPFVDTASLGAYSGGGYYRSGGAIAWLADYSHAGGWYAYQHSAGNYFKDGWANWQGAHATPVATPYCYAG